MTQLRDRMLEELERRNYAPGTAKAYLFAVKQFAEHFHCAPDQLGAEHIREYQLCLFRERKLAAKTVARLPSRPALRSQPQAHPNAYAHPQNVHTSTPPSIPPD